MKSLSVILQQIHAIEVFASPENYRIHVNDSNGYACVTISLYAMKLVLCYVKFSTPPTPLQVPSATLEMSAKLWATFFGLCPYFSSKASTFSSSHQSKATVPMDIETSHADCKTLGDCAGPQGSGLECQKG